MSIPLAIKAGFFTARPVGGLA